MPASAPQVKVAALGAAGTWARRARAVSPAVQKVLAGALVPAAAEALRRAALGAVAAAAEAAEAHGQLMPLMPALAVLVAQARAPPRVFGPAVMLCDVT